MNKIKILDLTLIIVAVEFVEPAFSKQPNFLFLLSDDQAWNGLSCAIHPDYAGSKSGVIDTPNIARLAAEGMCFSAGYSPASVCSPTRISLQTGKSPAACHRTRAAPSVTAEDGFKLVPPVSRKAAFMERNKESDTPFFIQMVLPRFILTSDARGRKRPERRGLQREIRYMIPAHPPRKAASSEERKMDSSQQG